MEVKDILIKYGVDPGNTKKALADIAKASAQAGGSLDKTGISMSRAANVNMNFNRILQDSPYFFSSFNMGVMAVSNNLPVMAESLASARREGATFKQVLQGMFTGMGGWMTILNLGISAVLAYSLATRGAKDDTSGLNEETKKLTDTLNKMIDVKNPFGNAFTIENINKLQEAIKSLKDATGETATEISKMIVGADTDLAQAEDKVNAIRDAFIQIASQSPKDLGISEGAKERLAEILKDLKEQEEIYKVLEKVGLIKTEDVKKAEAIAKALEKAKNEAAELWGNAPITMQEARIDIPDQLASERIAQVGEDFNELFDLMTAELDRLLTGTAIGFEDDIIELGENMPDLILPGVSITEIQRRWKEANKESLIIANAFGATLREAGRSAFEDIFGKANSLLEIFLSNIASGFIEMAAQEATGGIFSWLTGGVSSIFEGIFGSASNGAGSSVPVVNTVVTLDGRAIAQATTPYVPAQLSSLRRTRRL